MLYYSDYDYKHLIANNLVFIGSNHVDFIVVLILCESWALGVPISGL
jgi:hypothetical protein